ncbi:sensor histidine kinase [Robertkochia marina]|uniref:histidine kinase n=1 Tax=Robertkochia marina TaxID=1227945 RepID=A0A4S3M1L8_9FLAO|nr:ATP-binding protein [Robertkochia marina]THD68994.1 sensor histidine kinase [Robertkochia marina]TRZ44817.1 sensor histidine kinase [Robertkochia marina]
MARLKRDITAKVLISYLILLILTVSVGWIIYSEINSFSRAQEGNNTENNIVFRIGGLLTLMYESESYARSAIQSNKEEPYISYLKKNDSINIGIDSLKASTLNEIQRSLLDSVKLLLEQKVTNIAELRQIRNDKASDIALDRAIQKFSNIEQTLGRLSLEDFVPNPANLDPEKRNLLLEQINIYNEYIPRDSSNTVDEKVLDSMVIASRGLLEKIRQETARRRLSAAVKENALLQNDLTTSQQLRQILSTLETELLENIRNANAQRQAVLNRSIRVLTWAAIIGILLVILFSLIILNDFFKNQQYRERLEKANQTTQSLLKGREQLISMVSHDLRTPLNTIQGYTELMTENTKSPREAYYAGKIKTASSYVTKLVDDLLDYTKLEADKVTIEPVPFDLGRVIEETAEGIKAIYKEKPITLNYKINETLPGQLISDPFRVKQILSNLLGNAYKFTDQGSISIETSYDEKNNRVTISVTDTGMGIPKEKQPLIFQEFTQAEDSHEKRFGGSGLGLFISWKLAQLLDGQLTLDSEKGKGSRFTLCLPARFGNLTAKMGDRADSAKVLTNKNVLIIDDDTLLLQMLEDWLVSKKAGVHRFTSASLALNKIAELDYDLIITDIQLPGMNGFRFLELLRSGQEYGYKDQPVIAVSGRKDLDPDKYLSNGFSAFLLKPYTPSHLLKVIAGIYSGKQPQVLKKPKREKKELHNALYRLDDLQTFLDHDMEAIRELLDNLLQTTENDLEKLDRMLEEEDYEGIADLAHRMKTMFRQIHATPIVAILEQAELQTASDPESMGVLLKGLRTAYLELKAGILKQH